MIAAGLLALVIALLLGLLLWTDREAKDNPDMLLRLWMDECAEEERARRRKL